MTIRNFLSRFQIFLLVRMLSLSKKTLSYVPVTRKLRLKTRPDEALLLKGNVIDNISFYYEYIYCDCFSVSIK